MTFHDIYAVADSCPRCYLSFENDEDQYFEHGFIHLYGIPDNLSESDVENIYNGGSDKSVYIGEIIGTLILGNQMSEDGEDFLMLCDDMSADLSYVASSFIYEDLIDVNIGVSADIYYIYELEMEKGFDDNELKQQILEKLPYILFILYHVKPQYLAYYPLPLDKSDADALIPKHSVSVKLDPKITANGVPADNANILLNDDELDTLVEGNAPYPVSAKNTELWKFYESCGFEEIGNTRMLYKEIE